jgi:phosphoesterase RecJ-like protein
VFEIASSLIEAGADAAFLARQVYDSASPQKLNLLALVLGTVEFHAGSRIATAELTHGMLASTAATYMDSEGFINHLRSVKSVDVAILFREGNDGMIHVSLRSRDGIDVARFAQRHGGGGHKQAAACRVQGKLEAVRSMVIGEVISYIN